MAENAYANALRQFDVVDGAGVADAQRPSHVQSSQA